MCVPIVRNPCEPLVVSQFYRTPEGHRFYTWLSSARILWPMLFVLVVSAVGTARSALAIGITAPSWKPRETVTDTLASYLYQDGSDRALAYDHHGNPGIAFYDDVDSDLRYARRVPGVGWVHTVIDGGGAVGQFPSLAYDRYERPAISYYENLAADLKYAHFDGTTWQIETMADSADVVGLYTSLAFDLLGRPAMAYFDLGHSSLKYIADTDGDLSLTDETPVTVADVFSEGRYASLVFDPLNRPMIAHQESDNSQLQFSVQEPGLGWVTTTVDNTGDTGYHPSIAIDPDTGYPAIAYLDLGNVDLRYADWDGDSWNLTTIDSGGSVGFNPSLTFDPADGNPAIAYQDSSNTSLKLGWYDGSSWQTQTVDAVGDVGRAPSLAFNDYGTGFPSIAYLDDGSGGTGHLYFIEDPPATVPEPTSLLLWTLGVAVLPRRRQFVRL